MGRGLVACELQSRLSFILHPASLYPGSYTHAENILHFSMGSQATRCTWPGGGMGRHRVIGHSAGGVPIWREEQVLLGWKGTGTPAGVLCLDEGFLRTPSLHCTQTETCRLEKAGISTDPQPREGATYIHQLGLSASPGFQILCPARNSG